MSDVGDRPNSTTDASPDRSSVKDMVVYAIFVAALIIFGGSTIVEIIERVSVIGFTKSQIRVASG